LSGTYDSGVSVRCPSAAAVRRFALGSVVANTAIVVTGGAVRLTDSGLGCPTWPRCTADSFVPTGQRPGHELIEFGNRTLTFVLGLVALGTLLAVLRQRPRRRPLVALATAAFLGIPAQAVLGGITVRTGLNPWTVAAHFLLSAAIVAVTVLLWWRAGERSDRPARRVVRAELLLLGRGLVGVTAVVLVLGTIVTGSGPHAGDAAAARTGFDPATVAPLHADAVMLLLGLTAATVLALRATRASAAVRRSAVLLLGVELAQGGVGYLQYFTGLPVLLVGAHLLGSQLVWIAALRVLLGMRVREPAPRPAGPPEGPVPPELEPTAAAAVALAGMSGQRPDGPVGDAATWAATARANRSAAPDAEPRKNDGSVSSSSSSSGAPSGPGSRSTRA
jgi:cytochrome c oxidase assembly protein subunit 15